MNKKKVLSLVAALTLVGVVGIGATLAYFTDTAEAANVFTMGHVDIILTETEVEVNDDGEYVQKETTIDEGGLEFDDVMPGQTVPKDPTITVAEGSENCYVRAMVNVESDGISTEDLKLLHDALKADAIQADNATVYNEETKTGLLVMDGEKVVGWNLGGATIEEYVAAP